MTESNIIDAVEALKQLIHDLLEPDMNGRQFEVDVHIFDNHGVRIAEVGYWIPRTDNPRLGGGASWLRADMISSGPVILACEQFLLCYGDPPKIHDGWVGDKYDPTFQDDEQEAVQAVRAAITEGKDQTPWVNRWPVGRPAPEAGIVKWYWYDADKAAAYDKAMAEQEQDA